MPNNTLVPIISAEQYTYIGDVPVTRRDNKISREYYQNHSTCIGLGSVIRTSIYEYYQPGAASIPTENPYIKYFTAFRKESSSPSSLTTAMESAKPL